MSKPQTKAIFWSSKKYDDETKKVNDEVSKDQKSLFYGWGAKNKAAE